MKLHYSYSQKSVEIENISLKKKNKNTLNGLCETFFHSQLENVFPSFISHFPSTKLKMHFLFLIGVLAVELL